MNARDICNALEQRYSPSEYVRIHEAPQEANRGGRKLDALIFSTWASRGFDIDGFEIKVSRSDWKRELEQAVKADWWWSRCHRFWLIVPAPHDKIVKDDELPSTWGLMEVVDGEGVKVVKKAPKHEAVPIPWDAMIGCLRAMQGTGLNVLHSRYSDGYNEGYKQGQAATKRETDHSAFARLHKQVEDFEAAAGFKIADGLNGGEHVGKAVKRLLSWGSPERAIDSLRRQATILKGLTQQFSDIADDLQPVLCPAEPVPESLPAD